MRISGFFHKTKNAKINVGLFSALYGIIFAVFPTCFTMAATTATTSEPITITGTVVDSETDEAVAFATVAETNNPPKCNDLTDKNGEFNLTCQNISEIEITFMGYKPLKKSIENTSNNTVSLGIIEMEPDVETLEKAIVTGEQSCDPKDLNKLHAKEGYVSKKEKKCVPTACESERYKLTGTDPNTKCLDLNNTDCKETINDKNIKTAKYKWENNQLICRVTNCNDKYIPNDAKDGCILGEGDCTQEQIQSILNATAGQLKKGVCYPTECAAGYEPDGEKCIKISGDCDPMPEHALRAHREYNSTMGTEVCIIDECSDEYTPSNDKLSCIKPTLTEEQSQARIDELQENADAMREREQSLANRMIGGASMGAMGIGGMQVASALAEQSADDAAELDMTAYLATFRCDYGAGQNIRGGETNITLPGANILLPLYNEYTTLAADLKSRKESLGMAPGIESETILDATLYDNESIGIADGAYTSLSRALSNPTGADAAEWAAQRAETAEQLKTGAIVAGVGAAVGIAGNILTNYVGDQPRERSAEINAKYDALRDELRAKLKPIERESETVAIQTAPEIESGKENTPEVKPTPPQPSAAETACIQNGGTWANNTCDCGTGKTWNSDTKSCTENEKPTPSNPELITINNAALFKYGSYDVGTQNETLDEVIKQLSNADFTNNPAKLVLVAHTDSDGIKNGGTLWNDGIKTNEQLGRKRADAVKEYIEKNWTNKPTNVEILAWSAGDSCADKNATDEQKKQERKVVFYLFYDNQTDDMSNFYTLQNNKCSTFNTAASSVPPPPSGSITSNTDINDADTTELITAAQNCNLGAVQNLIGNSNFEITAEITRAYQAVEQKCWSSDHEPSNSCCQTNDFIAKKIYNKLKEYIDADDVASMEKVANLLDIDNDFRDWVCPYSEGIIIEPHPDDMEYTDNLLYYTIDKDSEDIFKVLTPYIDSCTYGSYSDGTEKNYGDIILLFPDTEKALKYANLYVNLYANSYFDDEEEITDEEMELEIVDAVSYLCTSYNDTKPTDTFIRALDAGKIESFKWCLDNASTDKVGPEIYPEDFYYDKYKNYILDQISPYTYISQQCNNGKPIYCEAKEYSEQWICDMIKKFPEWYELSDFDGLTCN